MCSQQESQEHSPGKKLKGKCQINPHLCLTPVKAGPAKLSLMEFKLFLSTSFSSYSGAFGVSSSSSPHPAGCFCCLELPECICVGLLQVHRAAHKSALHVARIWELIVFIIQ